MKNLDFPGLPRRTGASPEVRGVGVRPDSKSKAQPPPLFFSSQVREARWFYLDLAPPSDVPLAVVCGGCEVCQADYAIHRRTFAYTAIEFVAQGRGRLTLAGQSCDLLPGSVFAYANDIAHDITTDPKQPLVKYFVELHRAARSRSARAARPGARQSRPGFRRRRNPGCFRPSDRERAEGHSL